MILGGATNKAVTKIQGKYDTGRGRSGGEMVGLLDKQAEIYIDTRPTYFGTLVQNIVAKSSMTDVRPALAVATPKPYQAPMVVEVTHTIQGGD